MLLDKAIDTSSLVVTNNNYHIRLRRLSVINQIKMIIIILLSTDFNGLNDNKMNNLQVTKNMFPYKRETQMYIIVMTGYRCCHYCGHNY